MIRISQIKLRPGQRPEELERKIRKVLRLAEKEEFQWRIAKSSIDARKKPDIFISYTVEVEGLAEQAVMKRCRDKSAGIAEPIRYRFPPSGIRELSGRPVIVGMGPAGLFCGYMLARYGYRPILLERGREVEERRRAVETFWETGILDPECNVQFGEGGAGTFSDGKLNTLVKDKEGRNQEVLRILAEEGAPESILYEGKPHIGTDILSKVVKHMRQTIEACGGEVRFRTKMEKLLVKDGKTAGILVEENTDTPRQEIIETDVVVLAIGHSARDTFQMLYDSKVPMEAKAFAVGLRVEHPQKLVNLSQYGVEAPENLPPASYKLTARSEEGRGIYTFCMCPGGYVVNASSEKGRLAVNGMSYSGRDGENANSAVVVSVTPKDYGSSHPLGGLFFQRRLEERAYEVGKGKVPVEYYGDFKCEVKGKGHDIGRDSGGQERDLSRKSGGPVQAAGWESREALQGGCVEEVYSQAGNCAEEPRGGVRETEYMPQIKGQWQFAPVHEIMPDALNRAFIEGMEAFGRTVEGFASDQVLLSGIESRTSSPVRIHRDGSGQSAIRGLYPCGEGAGYAGGITSAAMDGMRIAELIAGEYKPLEKRGMESKK